MRRFEARGGSPIGAMFKLAVFAAIWATLAVALLETARRSPAVDPAHRIAGPNGGWTTERLADLYEPARYRQAMAEAHLAAALRAADATAARAAADRARELARESLATRPANAFAWTTLALAERARDDASAATSAFRKSATLGPNALYLARTRLLAFADLWPRLSPEDRRLLLRDLALVGDHQAALDAVLAAFPGLERRLGVARLSFPTDRAPR